MRMLSKLMHVHSPNISYQIDTHLNSATLMKEAGSNTCLQYG